MMTTGEWLKAAEQRLTETRSSSPRLDAEVLLAHALQCERTALLAHPERDLGAAQAAADALLTRRADGVPVAYLTGHREFMGLDFIVTEDVLIPRPETELLVETVLEREQGFTGRALELGTGSGCISITLATRGTMQFFASDVTVTSVKVAQRNVRALGVADRVRLAVVDWDTAWRGGFDVLVSNPPYVRDGEYNWLGRGVKREPVIALLGGDDGLRFYRSLTRNLPKLLVPGGRFYFEMGIIAPMVEDLFRTAGYNDIEMLNDLSGWPRVMVGRLP